MEHWQGRCSPPPDRPSRTLPGGSLRKFPRGLGQFSLSFPAESRRDPALPMRSRRPSQCSITARGERSLDSVYQSTRTRGTDCFHGVKSSNDPIGTQGHWRVARGFNFLPYNRDQRHLMPPALPDWLPDGDLAWFLLNALAQIDLAMMKWTNG